VRRSIGADSLGYVSLDGLVAASDQPRSRLCAACFDGDYPIPLPAAEKIGKHLLEDIERGVSGELIDPSLPAGYGAEDALRRP
jgi:amidophosphoribosyltransferase